MNPQYINMSTVWTKFTGFYVAGSDEKSCIDTVEICDSYNLPSAVFLDTVPNFPTKSGVL